MSDNNVRKDIENYLNENIEILHDQLNKNEELYKEVKDIFDDQRNTPTFGNLKNITEIANTLSKIRSTGIDASDRLFKAKTTILTMEQNIRKLKNEEDTISDTNNIITKFNEMMNSNKEIQQKIENMEFQQQKQEIQQEKLEEIINKKFESGELQKTNNDKLAFEKFNATKDSNFIKKEINDE